ncbi:MAG: hypothetical protein CMJ72_13515 [Planctomycetaceae bacterium]|nr:hypothetical protein [Planctomycetaceae bacterium]HCK40084.1 hypothetical protein [Planctomycetaceae bacterium]|tara:strand:+ start:282 stop:839 length:558 start_codon:yes stop_codon:yes gene_type:complete
MNIPSVSCQKTCHHQSSNQGRVWQATFTLLLVFLQAGCSDGLIQVKGRLLLDGKPLSNATVTFYKTDQTGGRPASGLTQADGSFELTSLEVNDGLAAGEYTVTVLKLATPDQLDVEIDETMDAQKLAYMASSPASPYLKNVKNVVPPDYGNLKKSPFKCTIPPKGEVVFELDSSYGRKSGKRSKS